MHRNRIHQRNIVNVDNSIGPTARVGRGRGGRGPGRHGRGRARRAGRRTRVNRGEVRAAVLLLLAEEPMHGYQIMQELEERSGGGWQPSPGSIYPTLQQLADEGLIHSEAEGGKNIFSLTDDGHELLDDIEDPPVWDRMADSPARAFMTLRRSVGQLGAAAKQVASAGTDAQIEAALGVIDDARKALYRILAEDPEPTGDDSTGGGSASGAAGSAPEEGDADGS